MFYFSKSRTCNAGLFHAGIIFFLITATNIYVTINASKNVNNWMMLEYPDTAQEVTLLISYYSIFFVVSFAILRLLFYQLRQGKTTFSGLVRGINQSAVIVTFFIIYGTSLLVFYISPWSATYFSLVVDFATVALIVIMLLKSQFFIILSVISLYAVLAMNLQLIIDGDVNRGGVFQFCAMVIFMVSSIRQSSFFAKGNILILLLFVPVLLATFQVAEATYSGATLKKLDIINFLLRGFEIRPVENFVDIFLMLKEGELEYWSGKSIYLAFNEIFFPFSNEYLSATNWYQKLVNSRLGNPDSVAGYGFSIIADGYLNFGITGVLFMAVSVAILLFLVELSYSSTSFFVKLLGAKLFLLCYYLLRADLVYVIKTIWLNCLAILIYVVIYGIMHVFLRAINDKNTRFE